jgi:hypothetical protein
MLLSTPSAADAVSIPFAILDSRHSPMLAKSDIAHGASLSGRLDRSLGGRLGRSLSGRLGRRGFGKHGIICMICDLFEQG